jgi:hypothetical protein
MLIPTLAAAALLVAGLRLAPNEVQRVLAVSPLQAIGALSYSLYLWHWPFIVAAGWWLGDGTGSVSPWLGVAAVAASVTPAVVAYRFVERPLHHSTRLARSIGWSFATAAICMAVGVSAGSTLRAAVPDDQVVAATNPQPLPDGAPTSPSNEPDGGASPSGALVLGDDPASDRDGLVVDVAAAIVPSPVAALEDAPTLGGERCMATLDGVELVTCEYGAADAETVVAIVGDSKMHQWLPALQWIADERDWRLLTFLKSSCPLVRVPVERDGVAFEECRIYNELRFAALADPEIDIVVVTHRTGAAWLPGESAATARAVFVDDLRAIWSDFERQGRDVIVLLDNPAPLGQVPDCVESHRTELSRCAFDREEGLARSGNSAQAEAAMGVPGVTIVDPTDWVCPGELCPAVIGNVLVYRQGSHLTATYVRSLAPRLQLMIPVGIGTE